MRTTPLGLTALAGLAATLFYFAFTASMTLIHSWSILQLVFTASAFVYAIAVSLYMVGSKP